MDTGVGANREILTTPRKLEFDAVQQVDMQCQSLSDGSDKYTTG